VKQEQACPPTLAAGMVPANEGPWEWGFFSSTANSMPRARIFKLLRSWRNRLKGIDSANLCRLAGRYDNPIPTRFLARKDCYKIPAQNGSMKEHRGVYIQYMKRYLVRRKPGPPSMNLSMWQGIDSTLNLRFKKKFSITSP
jgi:hypothetical protein